MLPENVNEFKSRDLIGENIAVDHYVGILRF